MITFAVKLQNNLKIRAFSDVHVICFELAVATMLVCNVKFYF